MRTNYLCSLKIWEVSHFAVFSHKLLLNTICNALKPALHSINKRITKDTTNVLLVQPNTNNFIPILSSVSIIYPSPVDINSTICISCHSATQINTQTTTTTAVNNGYIHRHGKSYHQDNTKHFTQIPAEYRKKFSNKTYVTFNIHCLCKASYKTVWA